MSEAATDLGIVVIAHGSRRAEANQDLYELAERMRLAGFRHTFPAFLELAEPTILDAGEQCVAAGVRKVVLAPFFLSNGRHVREDLENFRRTLAAKHPTVDFRLAGPLGPHPFLDQILAERIREALPQG